MDTNFIFTEVQYVQYLVEIVVGAERYDGNSLGR
jgi:hypothetical protein